MIGCGVKSQYTDAVVLRTLTGEMVAIWPFDSKWHTGIGKGVTMRVDFSRDNLIGIYHD